MALTFPLSLADFFDTMKVNSAPFMLVSQQEYSGLGSGEGIAADLGPKLWEATVSSSNMKLDDALALQAKLDALDGSTNSFYAYSPTAAYPQADPDGSLFGVSTPTINAIAANRKEMRLTGLPDGYILTAGDFLHIDYGSPSRRALVRLVTGATASVGGLTPLFEIRPHLRPGITTTLAVTVIKAAMKCKIVPGSISSTHDLMVTGNLSFTMRQTLAAG